MYFNDPLMPLIFIALAFSFWAQWKVKATYERYAKIEATQGMTAADVARAILDAANVVDVKIERIAGELSDNYDSRTNVLHLSTGVHDSSSIAAYGIAAHEAGHAIQHAKAFKPLKFRNGIYPVASLGSNLAIPMFFVGVLFSFPSLMDLGIICFSLAVVFSVITLPVEFDASKRALVLLKSNGMLTTQELSGAKSVLSAAALTYLAATLMAVLQLLRLFFLRNSRND
jgi:Zn-dependent membrane protease YugP